MNDTPLQTKLADAGFKPFSYSGRGMMGKTCVAIKIETMGDLLTVGAKCGYSNEHEPCWDNLGKGYVLYWPQVPWNDGLVANEAYLKEQEQ